MRFYCFTRDFFQQFSTYGFLSISLALYAVTITLGAPGDLDLSFGNGGKVTTQIGNADDVARAVAIQSDGKIVAAGYSRTPSNNDFSLVRYNIDSTLDPTFGVGGKVITPVGAGYDSANAVAIQSDGKIIVVGYSDNGVADYDFAIVRYNIDGSLDSTFGVGGKVVTSLSNGNDNAHAVAIQPDGKIIAAGISTKDPRGDFALVRYNTDGLVDTSFGKNGIVTTQFAHNIYEIIRGVVIQSDGKIVAAGSHHNPKDSRSDFALARYNIDGTLDSSFGTDGKVVTDVGSISEAPNSIAIQSNGKIVAGGYSHANFHANFALVRYNIDGSLDSSFGTGGIVLTIIGTSCYGDAMAIQTDGKIIMSGQSYNSDTQIQSFALARYNTDGALDFSFGTGGKATTNIEGNNRNQVNAVAIQPDGRIVLAGSSANVIIVDNLSHVVPRFALVRYLGASSVHTQFDFDGDGKADQAVFRPSNNAWYLLGSQSGFTSTQFGVSTDKLAPADFDGDGRTDITVFREGYWYRVNSSNNQFVAIQFGQSGDVPVPADYDGDSKADLAVFRPSIGAWYLLRSTAGFTGVQFGQNGDVPVPADFDGDGKTDLAVFRNGVWYLLQSTAGFTGISFGQSGDKPVVADYDGDNKADQAVFRQGAWYLLRSTQGFTGIQFGAAGDVPAPADYDGDAKADLAVFRNGEWYLLRTTTGFFGVQFGATGDKAVPSAFVP